MKAKFTAVFVSLCLLLAYAPIAASAAGMECGDFIVEKYSSQGSVSFNAYSLTLGEGGQYRVSMKPGVTSTNMRIIVQAGARRVVVVLNNVTIDSSSSAFYVDESFTGDIDIVLVGDNYLAGDGAIRFVEKESARGTLTLSGGGTLTAFSKNYEAAAIGGENNDTVKNITIAGGTVNASVATADASTYFAAAIGSGVTSTVKNITITGGSVTAIGGGNIDNATLVDYEGPGIGGGSGSSISNITITGGVVNARAVSNALYGIGGTIGSTLENVVITGGSVRAVVHTTPKNAAGEALYCADVNLKTMNGASVANAALSSIEGYPEYGTNGVYSSSIGYLYLWLPAATQISAIYTTSGKCRYYGNADFTFTMPAQQQTVTFIQDSSRKIESDCYGCGAASVLLYKYGTIPWNKTEYLPTLTEAVSGVRYSAIVKNIPTGYSVYNVFAVNSDSGEVVLEQSDFTMGYMSEGSFGGTTYSFVMPEGNTRIMFYMKNGSNVSEPTIVTAALPSAVMGEEYSANIELFAAAASVSVSGTLPPGLSLVNGAIVGTPTAAGLYEFKIRATNSAGYDLKQFDIVVSDPSAPVWSGSCDYMLTASFTEPPTGESYILILAGYDESGRVIISEKKENALSITLYGLTDLGVTNAWLYIWSPSLEPLDGYYLYMQ